MNASKKIIIGAIVIIIVIVGFIYTLSNKGSLLNNISTTGNTGITSTTKGQGSSTNSVTVIPAVDTSNWSTYTNIAGGYSLKYPSGTQTLESGSNNVTFVLDKVVGASIDQITNQNPYTHQPMQPSVSAAPNAPKLILNITSSPANGATSPMAWYENTFASQGQAPTANVHENTTVDGVPALYLTFDGTPFGIGAYTYVEYAVLHNGSIYKIVATGLPQNTATKDNNLSYVEAYAPLVNEMISSLRFTN